MTVGVQIPHDSLIWKNQMMVEEAKIFAAEVHKGQMYGSLPYVVHLYDVYLVLWNYGIRDEEILTAAWLHDSIEDTTVTYSKIKKRFGVRVAEIVYALTDELGRNRKERHEKTYPKLQLNPNAILVKLADRVANMKTGIREKNDLLTMYKKEYLEFKDKLRVYQPHAMWNELDEILEGGEVN